MDTASYSHEPVKKKNLTFVSLDFWKERKKKNTTEKVFEEIVTANFPNLTYIVKKLIEAQIGKTHRNSYQDTRWSKFRKPTIEILEEGKWKYLCTATLENSLKFS